MFHLQIYFRNKIPGDTRLTTLFPQIWKTLTSKMFLLLTRTLSVTINYIIKGAGIECYILNNVIKKSFKYHEITVWVLFFDRFRL